LTQGIDKLTREWIRNASDEKAAKAGCRFDLERAEWAVSWIERFCRLYEGEFAGQKMELHDWQGEAVRRIFGWVKFSIEWNREIRRFRRGSVWVPKKNKKSPTLAAIGLYLLCGDGEQGQKVFSCAKDGGQAMIAHTHAMEMVRRSPELSAECSINKSTGRITHEPSRSFYSVIAGDNINSQEGLNGSVLVDETHVVDRRLMKVLKGAGISRSEPLQLEFSTAGNNPDGYGKEQFIYGAEVERGEREDEGYFYLAYAGSQDLTDDELDRRLVEIGKTANPAWGHTIHESEFVSAYQQSKHSISELADFKMYRLNIWQKTTSPWLRVGAWEACAESYTEDDMVGQPCYAGLDLSRSRDSTSLTLAFKCDDGIIRFLPFIWLPEQTARERNHLVPYADWEKSGDIFLMPGGVCDYAYVESKLAELHAKFQIRNLAYDPCYAEELTQRLEVNYEIPRVLFKQSPLNYTAPTTEFERLVITKGLRHNGNKVFSWHVGNIGIKFDPVTKLLRPVKVSKDDWRSIDSGQAAIMALSQAMLDTEEPSVYETRGILTL
jgi:phage terminase large subunit-like protein